MVLGFKGNNVCKALSMLDSNTQMSAIAVLYNLLLPYAESTSIYSPLPDFLKDLDG